MPQTRLIALTGLATVAATLLPLTPASATPGVDSDVPASAPAAAHRQEPGLAAPDGWPFEQRLSRTSGTGRLHDGALYWSDFVYDDKGAAIPGGFTAENTAYLAPEQGAYAYPEGPAAGNGADVFVAAVGATPEASYWRVDWTTLKDADVPLAVWTFDTDDDAATGAADWPAEAGVTSPGIDQSLVVSSRGAWLVDPATGERTSVTERGGDLTVDKSARSFVVRVPTSLLPVDGDWKVRLGTGLASADGTTMAAPYIESSTPAPPGLPHVYNLAFRKADQEKPVHTDGMTSALVAAFQAAAATTPPFDQIGSDGQARFVTGNFWMEDNQADTLAGGDVSKFGKVVDWQRLLDRDATAEPSPSGYTNRWYVSSLDLGQGVVENDGGPGTGDGRPNYLSRIQPYAVYVPTTAPDGPRPLTWVLHSLGVNHNQYGGLNPTLLQQLCEDRDSVCASTLGYGPDGWYFDEAENDYWSVWRELAQAYRLDPTRTQITGYSMGGFATYQLGLAHPDLYAGAVSLAGPPQCGVSPDGEDSGDGAVPGRCTTDGRTGPLVGNARWMPFRIGQGTEDELVPFTSVERQVTRFDDLDQRYRFVRYPGEDHLIFATQDRFETVVGDLGTPVIERRPPVVDFTWRPHLDRAGLGIGATTAYWLGGLEARNDAPGTYAGVRARSFAIPLESVAIERTGPTPVEDPLPAAVSELRWGSGKLSATSDRLTLRLDNTRHVSVDLERAGLTCGVVVVRTDGPATVRLTRPGVDATRTFGKGRSTWRIGC